MQKLITAAMAAALLMGGAGAASAQPYGGPHGPGGRPGWGGPDHSQGYHGGWRPEWRRGSRIDRDYWRRGASVDWRAHHLRRPPRGYEWRYVDGRYVMAAVATGIIADIIMNAR